MLDATHINTHIFRINNKFSITLEYGRKLFVSNLDDKILPSPKWIRFGYRNIIIWHINQLNMLVNKNAFYTFPSCVHLDSDDDFVNSIVQPNKSCFQSV